MIMLDFKKKNIPNDKVTLIGMMGTGKSKFGRLVANNLNFNFYDVDSLIENNFKTTIKDLFSKYGELFFRNIEHETIKKLIFKITENKEKVIISIGGGAFDNEETRKLLLKHTNVIWLNTPVNILVERVGNGSKRPMIKGDTRESITKLLKKRTKYYSLSHYQLSTQTLSTHQVTEEIIKLIFTQNNKAKNEIRNN